MSKVLILFYSYEGQTREIARIIADELHADLAEVKPVKERKTKGFAKYLWGGSQVVMKKKPALQPLERNPEQYDTLFVGTPVWASTFAPPVKSLLEDGLLQDKKIAFFYTHLGGPGKTEQNAREVLSKNNTFLGALGCANVAKHLQELRPQVVQWAQQMLERSEG
ncbi:MAG TPA: flavodoxin [Thermotogota bacterium]|nr:flavodoxin [Thermotogota bacterium]